LLIPKPGIEQVGLQALAGICVRAISSQRNPCTYCKSAQ